MFAASKSGSSSVAPVVPDAQFPLVTTLLTGNGTNGAQNNTFVDSSTNAFTVTRNGNATQGSVSPFGANWSNYFNGSSTINLASSAALLGAGNFTIEFWVNIPNLPTAGAYFTCCAYGSTGSVLRAFVYEASGVFFGVWIGATRVINVATPLTAGQWAHIAIVRSGTTLTVYINGVSVGTYGSDSTNYNTGTLYIASQAATNYLTGYISNFRILVGTALYTTAFTPPTAPLQAIANTKFLTCQSPTAIDNSVNQYAITATGNPAPLKFSPFSPIVSTPISYSSYFDGNGDYLTVPSLISATGDFTLECWINTSLAISTYRMICGGNIDLSASNYAAIYPSGFEAQFGGGSATVMTAAYTFVPNTWYHVAMTRSGTTVKVFVNGVSLTTVQGTQSGTFAIRYIANGYNNLIYNGCISNLRFIVGTALYTTNFTPPTTPLTAITGTALLTCQNSTFVDNSTNNFAITAFGNSIPINSNPFGFTNTTNASYAPSSYGGTVYLDGTGDYLQTPNSANLDLTSTDFTFECWIYPTIVNSAVHPIANYSAATIASSADIAFRVFITTTNLISFVVFNSGTSFTVNSLAAVKANTWYHIAAVRNGGQIYLYVNGVYQGYITNTLTTINNSSTFVFQVGGYNNSLYFGGYISGVRFTKAVVYSPIVSASVTSSFAPPVIPPTAITNTQLLLNSTNGGIYDNAMMNDYETVGNVQISTSVSKFGGGSMFFDGTGDYLTSPATSLLSFGTGDFTVEFWCWFQNIVGRPEEGMIETRTAAAGTNQWLIYKSFGTATLEWFTNAGSPIVGTLPGSQQWIHVAVVRSSGVTKMYINGTQSGASYTDTNNYQSTGTTYIGCWYTLAKPLYGYIDDLRITKGYARYTANFTPPTTAFPTY